MKRNNNSVARQGRRTDSRALVGGCLLFFFFGSIGSTAPAAGVSNNGGRWTIENHTLRVSIDPAPGSLSVLDKRTGQEWRGPAKKQPPAPIRLSFSKALRPVTIDGDLSDWAGKGARKISHRMTADAKVVDGGKDCSASFQVAWDERNLYVAVNVKDDAAVFGKPGLVSWWEKDSVELWVGDRQVGLNLSEKGSQARTATDLLEGARIALRRDKSGYIVEAMLPWKILGKVQPGPGESFPFALGVNDADTTGHREGQIYFPATWKHSRPATYGEAVLAGTGGQTTPASRAKQAMKFQQVRPLPGGRTGLEFRAEFQSHGKRIPARVRIWLEGEADLWTELDPVDRSTRIVDFPGLEPFVFAAPRGALVVPDYCNGHIYPLHSSPFPKRHFNGNRLDMPWLGVADLERGSGYMLLLDTSDDCFIRMVNVRAGRDQVPAPRIFWQAQKGKFGYARRVLRHFVAKGSYVAMARRFRAYARGRGLIVPFREKLEKNPNISRLFGAPDVWGNASLAFARQAKSLGVDKMLLHGRSRPEQMKAIRELGYLPSEYDNYTDILPLEPGKPIEHNRAPLPDHATLKYNGKRMTAWLTYDKKTQYMKRCPALWVDAAQNVIPKILAQYPFLGRFIDVTTAEGLYECYDQKHPLTRTGKRECGVALESYVRSLGLVVGGEHGIWWGVPHMDYVEGMMSGSYYSWPAGHLKHPKTKADTFTNPWGRKLGDFSRYEQWGIGHQWRVPLWELVFHDCIVTTWYWGDASDWLLDAAPEISPKKDAYNILYGTIPLLWANRQGSWRKDRAVFLRTYRNTCKLHEQIAGQQMLSHEFLTSDHAVQRTRFSSGTEVVVNFGEEPRTVVVKGESFLLPQNGFAVRGPKITQSLELSEGKPVTTILAPGYWFSDHEGVEVTMRSAGPGLVSVIAGPSKQSLELQPQLVSPVWDLGTTRVYGLDEKGERTGTVPHRPGKDGAIRFGPFTDIVRLDVLCQKAGPRPDLALDPDDLRISPAEVTQGEGVRVQATISNPGFSPAHSNLAVYADQVLPEYRLASALVSLAPGKSKTVSLNLRTDRLDGVRQLVVAADPAGQLPELCEQNNEVRAALRVRPDLSFWPFRAEVKVRAGEIDRKDAPVTMKVDARALARRLGLRKALAVKDLRMGELDASGHFLRLVPFQFDPEGGQKDKPRAGELCWLMPGRTPAGATRHLLLLAREGESKLLPHAGSLWNERTRTIDAAAYQAKFTKGTLTWLSAKTGGRAGENFLYNLILSSKATGWSDEVGEVEAFEVRSRGPARAVIYVRKALKAGVVYEKTYFFYPGRFDLEISVNKPAGGLYSRAHYRLPGHYFDNKGLTAEVDGNGEENRKTYGKNRDPLWYAVSGKGWAHTCTALSKFTHIAYWDGGKMGAIGFVGNSTKKVRMSYAVHPQQETTAFGAKDWKRVTQSPAAEWEVLR